MAEEPEQLGLSNRDQAAQDKALDQLTDRVCAATAILVMKLRHALITLP